MVLSAIVTHIRYAHDNVTASGKRPWNASSIHKFSPPVSLRIGCLSKGRTLGAPPIGNRQYRDVHAVIVSGQPASRDKCPLCISTPCTSMDTGLPFSYQ